MPTYDTPYYIPNLWSWYKADAGVSVSGSTVTAWTDQSTNGRNATIVGSPTRALASLNGLATIAVPNYSAIRTAAATAALTTAGTMIAVFGFVVRDGGGGANTACFVRHWPYV